MTRSELETLKRLLNHLSREVEYLPKRGCVARAATFRRWRDAVQRLVAEQPRGCVGCYYEGEEVNRCMTCSQMTWRTDKFTKTEVK